MRPPLPPLCSLVLGLLLCSDVALAQDYQPSVGTPVDRTAQDERAKELYQNGAMLYDEGRYEDAIAAWEEAYRLSGRELLLYNLASAYERMGDYQAALDYLSRYRAFAPAAERESLERRITNIERRMATGGQPGPGVEPETQTSQPVTAAQSDTGGQGRSTGAGSSRDSGRAVPLALFGTSAAGTVVGVTFGLRAVGARRTLSESCAEAGGNLYCPTEVSEQARSNLVSGILSDVGFALAIGGLAGGVLTLSLGEDATLGLGGDQLILTTRF